MAFRDCLTPYILRKLSSRTSAQNIETISWKNIRHTNTDDILKAGEEFYTALFSEKPTEKEVQDWLLACTSSTVLPNVANKLDRDITVSEICKTMKQMPRGKTPSVDGMLYRAIPGIE
jgi:hypothetical protein